MLAETFGAASVVVHRYDSLVQACLIEYTDKILGNDTFHELGVANIRRVLLPVECRKVHAHACSQSHPGMSSKANLNHSSDHVQRLNAVHASVLHVYYLALPAGAAALPSIPLRQGDPLQRSDPSFSAQHGQPLFIAPPGLLSKLEFLPVA